MDPLKPRATDYGLPEHVTCPFCGDNNTELHSAFGPQLSVSTYWCHDCHTAFEWMKWKPTRADSSTPTPADATD